MKLALFEIDAEGDQVQFMKDRLIFEVSDRNAPPGYTEPRFSLQQTSPMVWKSQPDVAEVRNFYF